MIEQNPLSRHPLPATPAQTHLVPRNRRKRNRLLLFIILAITAALLWKGIWEVEQFFPGRDIFPPDAANPPITELHPIVFAKQNELIAETGKLGISILITDGFRSNEEQDEIYARGRTSEGSVVTQVQGGDSYHNYGLAIDFALRTKKGEVVWDMKYDGNENGQADWMEVVAVAKQLGFTWGGDWNNFPDYPHLQMDFGFSIRQLKRGLRPPVE
ncbi:M15 family metallopeptidase [Paenibacillus alkaliterrae]|uniref:M15 family metallopeptidase n=1 Tax=Paenibacillus alkaliterrae TaxID=320909 RepID=UPI001F301185|nr:M15 family metallopeptidase [Paenibacillus alkaliterrae]MCF2939437.1 M15 family metallopeptidase [Paenibacillus alkaliterrae]